MPHAQGTSSAARHEAFSDLYNLSHTRKEDFVVPEIAIVGGDLETRSAVVDTILGVRLNIPKFETTISTPVVIQSFNKASCASPEIRVLNHGVGDFTPPLSLSVESAVADAVLAMTPQNQAAKAVVIRCQSSTGPNLQIFLPGQAAPSIGAAELGNDDNTHAEQPPLRMVPMKKVAKQLSSQSKMVIAIVTPHDTAGTNVALQAALRADRTLSRTTILVALRKADLGVIESTKKKAFHLLHADILSSLPSGATPSIAAVYLPPINSKAPSAESWGKSVVTADEALQAVSSRIAGLGRAPPAATGAVNTRAHLEKQFSGRQQAAAQGMLSMLQLRCDGARHCFEDAQRALEAMMDAGQLRRAHMATVSELLDCFSSLLAGKGCIDMDRHGLTSLEECDALGEHAWPVVALLDDEQEDQATGDEVEAYFLPIGAGPTAEVPLYGVAAAQRCLEEFDSLLEHAGTFGSEAWQEARRLFDVHRIANMLLAQDDIGLRLTGNMHGEGRTFFGEAPPPTHEFDSEDSFPDASPDAQRRVGYAMGRIAADQLLKPLVAALCTRLKQILTRLPGLALAECEERSGGFGASGAAAPSPKLSENFLKALEGKTCELVSSAQDHVQQQLATIIKHTYVASPWPQVPAAMGTGRLPGSTGTSVSNISHHLIASGVMHAQAVGEALSGSESGDDGDLSGLAAAMGRLQGTTSQVPAAESSGEGSDEDESAGDQAADEEEEEEEESEEEQNSGREKEEEDDTHVAEQPPAVPLRPPPREKPQVSSSPKKPEAALTTVQVSEDKPSKKSKKLIEGSTTSSQHTHDASVPTVDVAKDSPKKSKKDPSSPQKKGQEKKSGTKTPQQAQLEAEDPDLERRKTKPSKSAPGNLVKSQLSKQKSHAGQAADAAAAEALAAATPPESTAGESSTDIAPYRKKRGKSVQAAADLERDQSSTAVEIASPQAVVVDTPKPKKPSSKKSSKSLTTSPEPVPSHAQKSAPFEVPVADVQPPAVTRGKSSRATSRKSVKVSPAGSPEPDEEAENGEPEARSVVTAQPSQRSGRHSTAASLNELAATTAAAAEDESGKRNEDEEGDSEASEDGEDDVASASDNESAASDANRGSAFQSDRKSFRRESLREHPATTHPVYMGVMRHVGEMFDEIRASMTHYGISNCLRSALLQPLSSASLKQTAMTSIFSGNDSDMLAQYASQDAMHSMRCDLELAAERQAALLKCKRLFDSVAAGDANAQAASMWGGIEAGGAGSGDYY